MEKELRNAQKTSNYKIQDEEFGRIFFSGGSREDDARIKDKISKYKQSEDGAKLYGKGENVLVSSILYDKYHSISQAEKANNETKRFKKVSE